MSEQFEKMTVLELRRTAKEMGVKLGAGISKQGIIDKLTEAAAAKTEETPASYPPAPAHPVRSAAIITDDEPEDEDDIPVLTPNSSVPPISRAISRPVQGTPASPAAPVSGISSKAPAFTMEGSRAWHNPRAYQNPNPSYNRVPQAWGAPRPAAQQGASADSRAYNRTPQQRVDPRLSQQPRPAAYPNRFGPADQTPAETDRSMDYRQAPAYGQMEYQAPRNDYAPRAEYTAPTRESAPNMNYSRPAQPASATPYYQKENAAGSGVIPEMMAMGECGDGAGVLEVMPDGYGFLRGGNYLPGKNDVYVGNAQVRRFSLRSGDYLAGKTKPQRENDRYNALLYVTEINGHPAEEVANRPVFEELTPIYPKRKMNLLCKGENDTALRLMDLIAPVGFGQRALIHCPAKADKAALIGKLSAAIAQNHHKAQQMLVLVDELPEEVTQIKENFKGEVVSTTFDEAPENQARVMELALDRAQRLVEEKKDVVILLNSLTAMARVYNHLAPHTARVLPCGLAASAMNKPKRFLGAARNTREGGSLTVIALFNADGGKMEEGIAEEIQGVSNMEWYLESRMTAENVLKGFSRRADLLLTEKGMEAMKQIRDALAGENAKDALQQLLSTLEATENNEEFVEKI